MGSMSTVEALVDLLGEIDGRGYKAYKVLRGIWAFPAFVLPADTTGRASVACATASRRLGVASLLARRFHRAALATMKPRGIGKSGVI